MTREEELLLKTNIEKLKAKISNGKHMMLHCAIISLLSLWTAFMSVNPIPTVSFVIAALMLFIANYGRIKWEFNTQVLKSVLKSDFEFYQ